MLLLQPAQAAVAADGELMQLRAEEPELIRQGTTEYHIATD